MTMTTPPIILTIAGSDPSGGAGIQADIKTIHACDGYAFSVITAITAQNTQKVDAVYPVPPEQIRHCLDILIEDQIPDAIKLGMLANEEILHTLIEWLTHFKQQHPQVPIIADTVLISSSGTPLLELEAIALFKTQLLPLCHTFTPNLLEARHLLNLTNVDEATLISSLQDWVKQMNNFAILKGGHSDSDHCTDTLITPKNIFTLNSPKICTPNLHGTGCTFASAYASFLAQTQDAYFAFTQAKQYITQAIEQGQNIKIGQGNGPLKHL